MPTAARLMRAWLIEMASGKAVAGAEELTVMVSSFDRLPVRIEPLRRQEADCEN